MMTVQGPLGSATFSDDRSCRYTLTRLWAPGKPIVLWVMLNPSKASEERSDATVTRCIDFSTRWGYGGLIVCNIWPVMETDAKLAKAWVKRAVMDPERRREMEINFTYIDLMSEQCEEIICAWGSNANDEESMAMVERLKATGKPVMCLGLTSDGTPKHPVRLAKTTERMHL